MRRSEEEIRERLRIIKFFIEDRMARDAIDFDGTSRVIDFDGTLRVARNEQRVLEWVLGEDEFPPPRDSS